jgi:hypothetical protein
MTLSKIEEANAALRELGLSEESRAVKSVHRIGQATKRVYSWRESLMHGRSTRSKMPNAAFCRNNWSHYLR